MGNHDPIIGGIRTQANQLRELLTQIESDLQWRENSGFYAQQLHEVEWNLRKLRKRKIRKQDVAGTFSF